MGKQKQPHHRDRVRDDFVELDLSPKDVSNLRIRWRERMKRTARGAETEARAHARLLMLDIDPEMMIWDAPPNVAAYRALRASTMFTTEFQQRPTLESWEYAFQLWLWYYEEAEAFDRTVCPLVVDGVARPTTAEQRAVINAHALWLSDQVAEWVALHVDAAKSSDLRMAACAASERKRWLR